MGFFAQDFPSTRVPESTKSRFKSEKEAYLVKNRARIVINSGFFKNLHCFFSEITDNVSSLFAVFRIVQKKFRGGVEWLEK